MVSLCRAPGHEGDPWRQEAAHPIRSLRSARARRLESARTDCTARAAALPDIAERRRDHGLATQSALLQFEFLAVEVIDVFPLRAVLGDAEQSEVKPASHDSSATKSLCKGLTFVSCDTSQQRATLAQCRGSRQPWGSGWLRSSPRRRSGASARMGSAQRLASDHLGQVGWYPRWCAHRRR